MQEINFSPFCDWNNINFKFSVMFLFMYILKEFLKKFLCFIQINIYVLVNIKY